MTRIETLLSQFFNPVPMLHGEDAPTPPSSLRATYLSVPIDRDLDVDTAAEIGQVLAHWMRLDLTFAVLWFSTDEHGVVILTPAELLLHRLVTPVAIP